MAQRGVRGGGGGLAWWELPWLPQRGLCLSPRVAQGLPAPACIPASSGPFSYGMRWSGWGQLHHGAQNPVLLHMCCAPRAPPRAVGQQRNAALRGTVPTFPMGKLRHGDGLLVSTMGWVFTLPQDSNHISLALSLILRAFFHQERQKPSPTSSYSCSGPDSSGGIGQWKECQTRAELTLLGFYSPNHPL